jgi:hypothetical protein
MAETRYTIGEKKFLATAQNQRSTDWGRTSRSPPSPIVNSGRLTRGFMAIMQLIYTLMPHDYWLQVDSELAAIVSVCGQQVNSSEALQPNPGYLTF